MKLYQIDGGVADPCRDALVEMHLSLQHIQNMTQIISALEEQDLERAMQIFESEISNVMQEKNWSLLSSYYYLTHPKMSPTTLQALVDKLFKKAKTDLSVATIQKTLVKNFLQIICYKENQGIIKVLNLVILDHVKGNINFYIETTVKTKSILS